MRLCHGKKGEKGLSGANESLIEKAQRELEAAPFLFSEDDLPKIDKARPKFHCTGERLFRDRPDVYKAVVKLLAEPGVSVRTICRECHVSDHTIRSVAGREGIAIATVKKEVLSNIAHGMRLASERVIELMPEASARDALLGVGILGDKMILLAGEPTMRIDIGPAVALDAKIQQLIDEATKQMKLAKAREMGLDGRNSEQKALTNGNHEWPSNAENGATNAVSEVDATSVGNDPKMIAIEQLPEGYGLLIIWFKLLTLAGEQNRGGAIYFTETVPFTAELLSAKWRCKPALVQMALGVFQKFGMIGIDQEATIWIQNWSKYQNEEGLARIRDRSLLQLEDRSAERSVRIREQTAERQRRWRQQQKKHGSNGTVTRNALRGVTVTPVTPPVTPDPAPTREQTVTPVTPQTKIETKIETKNKNLPPTVPQGTEMCNGQHLQGETEDRTEKERHDKETDFDDAKRWVNSLFGRQRAWSYEEDELLSRLLPISKEDRALLSWAYALPRDFDGWALVDGERGSKPKHSILLLLREFGSEIDKWRSVRARGDDLDEWTRELLNAAKIEFPGRKFPGLFGLVPLGDRRRIEARLMAMEDPDLTPEQVSAAKKLYSDDVSLPRKWSQLAPSVRDEITDEIANQQSAKKTAGEPP
jgi:predicted phage replisome organizer